MVKRGGPPDPYNRELYMGIPDQETLENAQNIKRMIEEKRARDLLEAEEQAEKLKLDLRNRDAAIQEANLQHQIEGGVPGGSGQKGTSPLEGAFFDAVGNLIPAAKLAGAAVKVGVPALKAARKFLQKDTPEQLNLPGVLEDAASAASAATGLGTLTKVAKDMFTKDLTATPASEDIGVVVNSYAVHGRVVGNQDVPIDSLHGGISTAVGEQAQVNELVDQIRQSGEISRLIIDQDNNVIEGAHRLEALRKMGVDSVPVVRIEDMASGMPVAEIREALKEAGLRLHPDQVNQLISNVLEATKEAGSAREAKAQFEPPAGFEKAWTTALDVIAGDELPTGQAHGGPVYASEILHMQNGGELPRPRRLPLYEEIMGEGAASPPTWDAFRYSGTREDVLRRRGILKSFEIEEDLSRQARTDPVHREMANIEYTMPYWHDIIKDPITALAWDPDAVSSIPGSDPGFGEPRPLLGWYDPRKKIIGINPKYGVLEEDYRGIGDTRRGAFEEGKRTLLHELRHKGLNNLGDLTASRWADLEAAQANKTYENPAEELSDKNNLLKAKREALIMKELQIRYRKTGVPFIEEDVVRLQDLRGSSGWERPSPDHDKDAVWARFNADQKMLTEALLWLDRVYPRPEWLASDEGAEALREINDQYASAQDMAREEIAKRWPGWNYQMPPESVYQDEFDPAKILRNKYGYRPNQPDDQLSPEQLILNADKERDAEEIRRLPPHPSGAADVYPGEVPGAAHGGLASMAPEARAMFGKPRPEDHGEDSYEAWLAEQMRLVNADDDAVQFPGPSRPPLPPIFKPFQDIRLTTSELPVDPRLPERGPPITKAALSIPLGRAMLTGSRTRVPRHSVGSTPSGTVNLKAEERGIRVDNFPIADYGPFSISLSGGISERKEKISAPEFADKIRTKLVDLKIVATKGDVQVDWGQTTQRVKGRPSQKFYRGGVTFDAYKLPNGTVRVFLGGSKPEDGDLKARIGISGDFTFAEGGLASMAPEARNMFSKPHSMVKEPRLTALGSSQGPSPGIANLCGVARNMNRSVVA